MSRIPPYKHRKNSETSFDSICTRCYRTIGKRETEAELEQDEKNHACRPVPSYNGALDIEQLKSKM